MSKSRPSPRQPPQPVASPDPVVPATHHSEHGFPTVYGDSAQAAEKPAVPAGAGSQLGPYQLCEKLGQGGMGAVYRAIHAHLDKVVAIKILPPHVIHNPREVERFKREMKAVGKVSHPHVVQAFDAGEVGGVHYLAMEYVEGTDLHKLVATRGTLSVQNSCKVIRQAAQGLAAAHQQGLVHRDVKPSNLLLAKKSGQVKLLDLGLARLNYDRPVADMTAPGQCLGTPDYMAPEQWNDAHRVLPSTDLYALGCTLFFLICGRPPYDSSQFKTLGSKMAAHLNAPIPSLRAARPEVSEGLERIYLRLVAKQPADRFATAQELVEALLPYTKDTVPAISAPPKRRLRLALTLLALAAASIVGLLTMSRSEPRADITDPQRATAGSTAAADPGLPVKPPVEPRTTPKLLKAVADQEIDEGKTLRVELLGTTSSDADDYQFSLTGSAPAGATIDERKGILLWKPTEEQGPGQYKFAVLVDRAGASEAQRLVFSVDVRETNQAPRFRPISDQTVMLGGKLNVALAAQDSDRPANQLQYALLAGPPAAKVDAHSGQVTWSPDLQARFGAPQEFRVRVTDDGIPAQSSTITFRVTPLEPADSLGGPHPVNAPAELVACLKDAAVESRPIDVQCSRLSPDLRQFAFTSGSGLQVWDRKYGRCARSIALPEPASTIRFSADNSHYAVLTDSGQLITWNDHVAKAVRESPNIRLVEFRPQGATLLIVPKAGPIELWDAKQDRRTFLTLGDVAPKNVASCEFAADGERLLLRIRERSEAPPRQTAESVVLFNVGDGSRLKTIACDCELLAFGPQGRLLALINERIAGRSPSRTNFISLIDAKSGQRLAEIEVSKKITGLAFSPQENLLAIGNHDLIDIWDVSAPAAPRRQRRFEIHMGTDGSLQFTRDARMIIADGVKYSDRRTLRVWNATTGRELLKQFSPPNAGRSLLSPDGAVLVAYVGGSENKIAAYRTADWQLIEETSQPRLPERIEFAADSRSYFVATADGHLREVDLHGKPARDVVDPAAVSPKFVQNTTPEAVLVTSADRKVVSWDLKSRTSSRLGILEGPITTSAEGLVFAINGFAQTMICPAGVPARPPKKSVRWVEAAWKSDKTACLLRSSEGQLVAWDASTGRAQTLPVENNSGDELPMLSFDGGLISLTSAGRVRVMAPSGAPVTELIDECALKMAQLSPNGQFVATVDEKSNLRIWTVKTANASPPTACRTPQIELTFSPDSKFLSIAGLATRLYVTATGEAWDKTATSFLAAAFSGRRLATATRDNQINIWDLESGRELAKWQLPTEPAQTASISFSPTGRYLFSARTDGAVCVFRLPTREADATEKAIGVQP
jgi:serine/threonine protein kinase/WD40 repeat protein